MELNNLAPTAGRVADAGRRRAIGVACSSPNPNKVHHDEDFQVVCRILDRESPITPIMVGLYMEMVKLSIPLIVLGLTMPSGSRPAGSNTLSTGTAVRLGSLAVQVSRLAEVGSRSLVIEEIMSGLLGR
jgi:hypothetical protein